MPRWVDRGGCRAPPDQAQADYQPSAWSSHSESGGYTEEAMAAVEALDDAGLHVVSIP